MTSATYNSRHGPSCEASRHEQPVRGWRGGGTGAFASDFPGRSPWVVSEPSPRIEHARLRDPSGPGASLSARCRCCAGRGRNAGRRGRAGACWSPSTTRTGSPDPLLRPSRSSRGAFHPQPALLVAHRPWTAPVPARSARPGDGHRAVRSIGFARSRRPHVADCCATAGQPSRAHRVAACRPACDASWRPAAAHRSPRAGVRRAFRGAPGVSGVAPARRRRR